MYRVGFWLFCFAVLLTTMSSGRAHDPSCPRKIGTIQNTLVYKEVEQLFEQVYQELGCELVLVTLPARRGIASFNNHYIDGEILRTPAVEKAYERDFLRSRPLFTVRFGLWGHGRMIERIGYLQGYVGQQKLVKSYMEEGRMVQSFASNEQMFAALQRGALDAVLTGELAWNAYSNGTEKPLDGGIQEVLATIHLHHYLDPAYKSFLQKFDQYLMDYTPFQQALGLGNSMITAE